MRFKSHIFIYMICFFSWLTVSKSYAFSVEINKVAAIVNEDVITEVDLNTRVQQIKTRLHEQHQTLPPDPVLEKQVMQIMVRERIQLQLAKRTGIEVSTEELNSAITNIAKHQHKSLKQFYRSLVSHYMSVGDFKKQIKTQLTIQKLQRRDVAPGVKITPQEIKMALQQLKQQRAGNIKYHVRNILVALPDIPTPAQVQAGNKRAEKLAAKLKKGAPFTSLAIEHSNGKEALEGGDLGWRSINELPALFEKVVRYMKPGQYAGPIRTPNGFQLINLAGIRNKTNKNLTLMEEKNLVMESVYRRKMQEALETWGSKLYNQAFVKINQA
jgi:peptidyl-prolyl cis-trans isomerase SurA